MTYATSVTNFTFDGDGTDINHSTDQTNAYEDYTSSNVAGSLVLLQILACVSMRMVTTLYGKIWIDLNNDDDFNDLGHLIWVMQQMLLTALMPVQSPSLPAI